MVGADRGRAKAWTGEKGQACLRLVCAAYGAQAGDGGDAQVHLRPSSARLVMPM